MENYEKIKTILLKNRIDNFGLLSSFRSNDKYKLIVYYACNRVSSYILQFHLFKINRGDNIHNYQYMGHLNTFIFDPHINYSNRNLVLNSGNYGENKKYFKIDCINWIKENCL